MKEISNIGSSLVLLALLMLVVVSCNQWSDLPIGGTSLSYAIYISLYVTTFFYIYKNKIKLHETNYIPILLFMVWAAIGMVRGLLVAENYWEYKNLFFNTCIVTMPIMVYVLERPPFLREAIRWWLVVGLALYALFFYWHVNLSQYYLGPLYFIACFLPFSRNRLVQVALIVLLVLLTMYQYQDNRSQMLKGLMTMAVILSFYVVRIIPKIGVYILHIALIVTPIVLLYLGLTGEYNIFEEMEDSYKGDNYIEIVDDEGSIVERDFMDDTRTGFYTEVIMSAIIHDYIVEGRTLARGNDTFFYDVTDDMMGANYDDTIKMERSMNECCFPNIFTWLGLIGMVLYAAIYIYASILAIYRSNNRYMPIFGLLVAAYFFYGWVENASNMDILNITYWMFIALCMSPYFRKMSNEEFRYWGRSLFAIY